MNKAAVREAAVKSLLFSEIFQDILEAAGPQPVRDVCGDL